MPVHFAVCRKSTLLNVLAGRLVASNSLTVEADISLDRSKVSLGSLEYQQQVAFFSQHDTLLATATPREAIYFSARLRLPTSVTNKDVANLTDIVVLNEISLTGVADDIIGGPYFRGLSGGETRRVSLGIELVTRPTLLLADEVTSGLDSHNAVQVLEVLRKVATSGATVLLTVHQPTSPMFKTFDHIVLLHEGRCMFQGSPDSVTSFFGARGHPLPPNHNSADWMLQVSQQATSTEELEESGFFRSFGTDENNASDPQRSETTSTLDGESNQNKATVGHLSWFAGISQKNRISMGTELRMLLKRDALKIRRDSHANYLRLSSVLLGGSFMGIVLFQVGDGSLDSLESFTSHVGSLFLITFVATICTQVVIYDFVETLPIFKKEYSTDHFRLLTFALSQLCFEVASILLQDISFIGIVYFMVGLNGRFINLLGIHCLFSLCLASLGVLLTSAIRDARDAKEMIAPFLCKFDSFLRGISNAVKAIHLDPVATMH